MRRGWREVESWGEGRKRYIGGGSDIKRRLGEKKVIGVEEEEKEEEDYGCSSAQRPASPRGPVGPIGPSLALY